MNEDYSEKEWQKDGRKILENIKAFDNTKTYLSRRLEEESKANSDDEILQKIRDYLNKLDNDIVPLTKKINNRTRNYNLSSEDNTLAEDNNNQPEGQMLIQDLANNKEVLEERRKNLEAIHQTSAKIKDLSDAMVKQLDEQGAILDNIEQNVVTTEDNAKKAKEEITKADEASRGNRKKMICLIIIILVAVGGVTAILLSLIL